MSDSNLESLLVAADTSRPQSSWTAINHGNIAAEHLNLPDLDELDKKFCWMLPDLIDSYKQAALDAVNPAVDIPAEADKSNILRAVSQRDILDKARGLVVAKFPSAAKSRTNPAPAPKVYARFNSFSDIDNMALHADTIDPDEPQPKKRIVKRKEPISKASDHPSPIVDEPKQILVPPSRRGTKRRAVEDVAVLEDAQPHGTMLLAHRNKKMRTDSDKENDVENETEVNDDPVLWSATVPTHKPRPSAAMNVSRKRILKDSSVYHKSNKRLKLDTQQETSSNGPVTTHKASSKRNMSANAVYDHSCQTKVTPDDPGAQESLSDHFSDQEDLFTQIIHEEIAPDSEGDDERTVSRDVSLDSIPSGIFSASSDMSATTLSMPQKTNSPIAPTGAAATPLSQADVEPSLRSKPTAMEDNTSPASAVGPKQGTITCFRIAEALRIRANTMNAPVLVSEASKPRQPIEIELFARINLTYRAASTQVFVFEDTWFPNRPPVLRVVHKSWQQCEQEASTLLRENSERSTEGGLLCRAMISLDTIRPTNSSGGFQGEVICIRAAEWDEVEDVRSIVEPQYQKP